jgi:hypothetical protein
MPALIAPGICRYTVNGLFNGRQVANIVDMQIDTTGSVVARDDAVDEVAGDILNNWSDEVLPNLTAQYIATSISWVDLDEADGSTGARTSTDGSTWPEPGGSSDASAQGNVAFRINKQGTARRGQRAGRMYLCGVGESANLNTNGNAVNPTVQTALTAAMQEFLSGINDDLGDATRKMVVLHVVGGIYLGYSDVGGLACDSTFGSQRRRLRD